MNKRGNLIIGLMVFLMGLVIMIIFISPIKAMIDIAQQPSFLNCKGYIFDGNVNSPFSFNATLNNNNSGSPLTCLVFKLYLPYLLLIFLIAGLSSVLSNRAEEMFFGKGGLGQDQYG